jgi:hypothetical protein
MCVPLSNTLHDTKNGGAQFGKEAYSSMGVCYP